MHIGPLILSAVLVAVSILTPHVECRSVVKVHDEERPLRNESYAKHEYTPNGESRSSNKRSFLASVGSSGRSLETGNYHDSESIENVIIGGESDLNLQSQISPHTDLSGRPHRRSKRNTLTPMQVGLMVFIVILCLIILLVGLYICYLLVQDTGTTQIVEVQVPDQETVPPEVPFYSQEESLEAEPKEGRKKKRPADERRDEKEQAEEQASSLQEQITMLLEPKNTGQPN